MSAILADVSRFQGAYSALNGTGRRIDVSLLGLAHAAMTVGQGDYGDVVRLGFFRLGQLLCTVDPTPRSVVATRKPKSRRYADTGLAARKVKGSSPPPDSICKGAGPYWPRPEWRSSCRGGQG